MGDWAWRGSDASTLPLGVRPMLSSTAATGLGFFMAPDARHASVPSLWAPEYIVAAPNGEETNMGCRRRERLRVSRAGEQH
jgi:hypothetical protein